MKTEFKGQPRNASRPIETTLSGMLIPVKLLHPLNSLGAIVPNLYGNSIRDSLSQFIKAASSIVAIESGKTTTFNVWQPSKALFPIRRTVSGMITDSIL